MLNALEFLAQISVYLSQFRHPSVYRRDLVLKEHPYFLFRVGIVLAYGMERLDRFEVVIISVNRLFWQQLKGSRRA